MGRLTGRTCNFLPDWESKFAGTGSRDALDRSGPDSANCQESDKTRGARGVDTCDFEAVEHNNQRVLRGSVSSQWPSPPNRHFKAVAFDYFVIFDPNSVVPEVERAFPGEGVEFTKAWRSKQFEYSFLRSITNDHEDFFKVTADALDYMAGQMHLELTSETRARLLNACLTLKPWPDAVAALKKLKAAGVRIITIANFSPTMLRANADNSGITNLFDELLSTEVNGTFKPDPRAYELGMTRL